MAEQLARYTQEQVDQLVLAAVVKATGLLNGQPVHVHRCSELHDWFCASPYCENVNAEPTNNCENHGGTRKILKGQEPWRGGR